MKKYMIKMWGMILKWLGTTDLDYIAEVYYGGIVLMS